MALRLRSAWVRVRTLSLAGAIILAATTKAPLVAQESTPPARSDGRSQAITTEPFAAVFSLSKAAESLDEIALNWTQVHRCGTCHTNYPYLIARPTIQYAAPALAEVRQFFEDRVAHWDDKGKTFQPKWDAEVVSTAEALALNDAGTAGKLHPLTRKALDRMWTVQKSDGGFDWLKCGWPPYEHDDYYGAIVAAVAAGHAPEGYAQSSAAQRGIAKLRSFFAKNPAPDMHHQTMLLWASTRLDGLMSADQKSATIARLRELERPDGGWNLASLGTWKRRDGTPNDLNADSDGYATGLIVYVLRQASVPQSDEALKRGVRWLISNQRASGQWFTRSLNNDKAHYIAHAGTAFAVMALRACGISGGGAPRQADHAIGSPPPRSASTADSVVRIGRP